MDLIEAADVASSHRHPWEAARLWVLRQLMARRVRLDPGSAVIDIGCGDAFVIGELARAFPHSQFFGIDAAFTPEMAARRQQLLPPNVRLFADLDALPADRPAALILLMDVLEHIDDDHGFLAGLVQRPIVGTNTRLIVTVPAFQGLFSSHDVFLKHFRRYTSARLQRTLESARLLVLDRGYFFATLLPVRLVEVLAERLSPPAERAGTGVTSYSGGGIKTKLLATVLKADAYASLVLRRIGISIPGLSTYAVCRTSA